MITNDTIVTYLKTDAPLLAVLTGSVWERGIKSNGPGETPEAFDTGTKNLKPCAVVSPILYRNDPAGAPGSYAGTVTIWLKSHDTVPNKTALNTAALILIGMLDDEWLTDPAGGQVEFTFAERYDVHADPLITGDLIDYVRFTMAGVRL